MSDEEIIEESNELVEESIEQETTTTEPAKHSSVEDDVKEALKQLEEEQEEEPEEPLEEEQKEEINQQDDFILPPERFNAEGKEWFNSLDPEGKRHIAKTIKDLEKHYQRSWREAAELKHELETERQSVRNLISAAEPHLKTWGLKGLTAEQAIAQLCAFQTLSLEDPDEALRALAKSTGRQIEIKNAQSEPRQQNYQPDPLVHELRNEIESLKRAQYQPILEQVVHTIDHEFNDLKNTITPDGRYMYPDMHDNDFVFSNVEPLARTIAERQPNLPWREIISRAYAAAGGRVLSASTNQATRLNGKRHIEIAKRARLSAPSSQASSSMDLPDEVPDKPQDTVRLAMSMLGM